MWTFYKFPRHVIYAVNKRILKPMPGSRPINTIMDGWLTVCCMLHKDDNSLCGNGVIIWSMGSLYGGC